jgi:DNA-binding transcriptional ArsR family regulator
MAVAPILGAPTRLEALKALRDRLAEALDNPVTSTRDLSSLSKQLVDVLAEIEKEEPSKPKEASPLDELNARRQERGAPRAREAGSGSRRQRRS